MLPTDMNDIKNVVNNRRTQCTVGVDSVSTTFIQ